MPQKRDGRKRIYRRRNERFARNCVLEVDNFGGGSLMMWGTTSYAEKTQLVHIHGNLSAARYRDEVLIPHMPPAMNLRREAFMHDNTRSHTAHATVYFLANQNVTVLHLPFKSLDLNPIEHLWMTWIDACAIVKQCRKALEQEWRRIPQDRIRRLVESMSRRVRPVIQANGGHNRYWLWSDVIWTVWTLMW